MNNDVIKQMVSHLFTKLNHTGKRFVLDTVYGIFWAALRTVDYKGGIDKFLKKAKAHLLSKKAKKFRNKIITK